MAEPYRSSVTAAELQRAQRPTGVLAHLLHAIAPPRTNKAYDSSKAAGEGNLPYAEPGFFRRLAGDPGRTWNQLAQEDTSDLATTRALANEEHNRAAQLADKEIGAKDSMLTRELQGYKDRQIMENAAKTLEGIRKGFFDRESDRMNNASALERTRTATERQFAPYVGDVNKATAEGLNLNNEVVRGALGAGGGTQPAQGGSKWWNPFSWGNKPGIKAQPGTSGPAGVPAVIDDKKTNAAVRPTVSTGTPMGMSEGNAALPSPWNILASVITGMDSSHNPAFPSPWKAAKKVLGVKPSQKPPVSVAAR